MDAFILFIQMTTIPESESNFKDRLKVHNLAVTKICCYLLANIMERKNLKSSNAVIGEVFQYFPILTLKY